MEATPNLQIPFKKHQITLNGTMDIMFDRYSGDKETQLRTEKKLYLTDASEIYLPALNIISLLTAQNTDSAPKRFLDTRKYKKTASAILSYVMIAPREILFLRDNKPIVFGSFDNSGTDSQSDCYIHRSTARLPKGIPNEKVRPVLPVPWQLKFDLTYFKNNEVQEETVESLLNKAGVAIGLGTFRGVFGKFWVLWE